MPSVLVTGATGYIGAHIVQRFLQQKWKVRATYRCEHKAANLAEAVKPYCDLGQYESVLVPDMAIVGCYDAAVCDMSVIVHCASVVQLFSATPYDSVYLPTVRGVEAILSSAKRSSCLKRLILTSSTGAIFDFGLGNAKSPAHVYTEADWNDHCIEIVEEHRNEVFPVVAYLAAKARSERMFWEFHHSHHPSFQMIALNPPFVFGPLLFSMPSGVPLSDSVAMVADIASGNKILRPKTPFDDFIDVRDCAAIHVLAASLSDLDGQRFLLCVAPFSESLLSRIIGARFPQLRRSVDELEDMEVQICSHTNSSKMRASFEMQFISLEQSVQETVSSLAEQQFVVVQ